MKVDIQSNQSKLYIHTIPYLNKRIDIQKYSDELVGETLVDHFWLCRY